MTHWRKWYPHHHHCGDSCIATLITTEVISVTLYPCPVVPFFTPTTLIPLPFSIMNTLISPIKHIPFQTPLSISGSSRTLVALDLVCAFWNIRHQRNVSIHVRSRNPRLIPRLFFSIVVLGFPVFLLPSGV